MVYKSVVRLTQEPWAEVSGSLPCPAIYFVSPSTDSRRDVFSYWRKYVHLVLVHCIGGLRLPRLFTGDVNQQINNNINRSHVFLGTLNFIAAFFMN